jgi:DNA-binding NarL/FixJ family response regulator
VYKKRQICQGIFFFIEKKLKREYNTNISYLGYMLTEKEIGVLKLKKAGFNQTEISKKLKITQPAVSIF